MEAEKNQFTIWDEINDLAIEIWESKQMDISDNIFKIRLNFKTEDLIFKLYQIMGITDNRRIFNINKYGYEVECIWYKNKYYPIDIVTDTIRETVKKYDYSQNSQFTGYFEFILELKNRNYFSNLKNKSLNEEDIEDDDEFPSVPGPDITEPLIVRIGKNAIRRLSDYENSLTNQKLFTLIYTHDSVGVIQDERNIERYMPYQNFLFALFNLMYIYYLYIDECETIIELIEKHFKPHIKFIDDGKAIQDDEMANFLVQNKQYSTFGGAKATISIRRKLYFEFIRKFKEEIIGG